LVAEFIRAYEEEVNRLMKEANGKVAEVEAKLASIQRKIDGIMRAIEVGLYQPSMKARLTELEDKRASVLAQQARSNAIPNISVHPNLAAVYRKRVEELESLLEDTEHKDQAMELIRSLLDKIVLTPKEEGGGLNAVLHGDLARILVLCSTGQHETEQQKALCTGGAGGLLHRHQVYLVAGI
jgi:DNA repair exonuclease SbcCD ATPase subunit